MIAKLYIHPDQIRWYAQNALNGFDDLEVSDAIENAKQDLRRILEYLNALDSADKAVLVSGIEGIEPGVGLKAVPSRADAFHKPDLKVTRLKTV